MEAMVAMLIQMNISLLTPMCVLTGVVTLVYLHISSLVICIFC